MKRTGILKFWALGLILLSVSCKTADVNTTSNTTAQAPVVNASEQYIKAVKSEYAPDGRVALFDVESTNHNGTYILKGESNLPEAVSDLKQRLKAQNIAFTDSIAMLPSAEMAGNTKGVIKISVANLRSKPSHSSELVTQAILGTPVKVYKKDGGWYYIQTPEGYLAWVDYGGVTPFSNNDLSKWKAADKVIYLETFGFAYESANKESQVVSDLVAGNILELVTEENGFYKVKYPHGKVGYIEQSKAQPYEQWLSALKPSGESLVETSKSLMGIPYLWGGTSAKGVDCSGYTKTIFFLNGIIIPRDASQQIHTGIEVDTERNFENLIPGDLLFFGRKATNNTTERVIHVGMWIGDNKFIHSMGDVHISNMDPNAEDFDEYNYNRYLRTKRVLGQEDEKLIQLTQSDLFWEKSK
ncbi:NlpC/P60 family protein [Antarcticibacterium arcticum]|uniref:NlpC/P60 family protein n=1 Tax=Antarcticibacterium arcticum TaxID=2585771 RepID=A0A5B8YP83_9FLAO|nr:SH3 domain-containing protein [Antarcticibacterium arcticum]QED38433.1 NlpC/P60 family protein [Antarcticibacterium arcticum]